MNILEMYKKLPKEDKAHLTIYCIYDSIYDVARNENIEISDEIAKSIQELSHELYLDDEYYNMSASHIAYFLTGCYALDNTFLDKVEKYDYSDILQAVVDKEYDFFLEEEKEMER